VAPYGRFATRATSAAPYGRFASRTLGGTLTMDFDFDVISRSLPYLWKGFLYTVQLTVIAGLGGLAFGTLLALARLSSNKVLSSVAAGYVNLMRSIPLILVIFWFFFLVPFILQWITGAERPPQVGAERTAIITFILFEAAYFCEIMRAGIQSIPKGQVYSAYALGLTYPQAMRLVILPQAFRNMLPVLLTQTVILFQDTSLVYVISATDFLGAASKVAQRDSRLVEMYSFVAVVYFVLCFSLSLAVKRVQQKIAVIR
jgi:glutamate/aspartate transport system permease protein